MTKAQIIDSLAGFILLVLTVGVFAVAVLLAK